MGNHLPTAFGTPFTGDSDFDVAPISHQPTGRVKPQGWDSTSGYHIMGFGKDGKGVIIRQSISQTLGTIDTQTSILLGTNLALLERFRIIKLEVWAAVTGLTSGEGTGLYLGIADGDLSVAEVDAALEANGPLGPNDTVLEELSSRWTMVLGATDHETGSELVFENEMGGHVIEKTIRWTFSRTKSWNYWIHNLGNQLTTGANVILRSKAFGVWVT